MTTVVDRLARRLESKLSRRSFVNRAALVGTAVAVGKGAELVLRPGTAYARVCGCAGQGCSCGSRCCTGYTAFCCTVNGGSNFCPPDTVMAGWWKADTSSFCGGGPRYYMDCNATCTCGSGSFCSSECDTAECGCAGGNCANWRSGCVRFRYGQCNQEVAPIGRIVCRMVACIPPWEIDPSCTRTTARDNNTAEHNAPCWEDAPPCPSTETRCQVVDVARTPTGLGYGLVTAFGRVFTYGDAVHVGDQNGDARGARVVGLAFASAGGYWLATSAGDVWNFGAAPALGGLARRTPDRAVVGIVATPTGGGYWLATANGGVLTFGDARFHGSLGDRQLNRPIVAMAATPSGGGYWLVAADGGIFTFGDAPYLGSLGDRHLNQPIIDVAATSTGAGYVLVAADGGVFTFGDAVFHGTATGVPRPVVGIAADLDGSGYWLAVEDGDVRPFDAVDHGSATRGQL
jgi:hypothetical protein